MTYIEKDGTKLQVKFLFDFLYMASLLLNVYKSEKLNVTYP